MSAHRTDRRRFLEGMAAAAVLPAASTWGCGGSGGSADAAGHYWLSAAGSEDDTFGLVASRDPYEAVLRVPTGFRGHDVAQHPARAWEVALFGRRPGTLSVLVDLSRGRIEEVLEAAPGRAFQGHGFFTPDGHYLVTSEADTVTAAGKLGIRETQSYSLVDELDTFGLGPHEIQLMPDGATVVIANGGLLTRPETGRRVLNLDTMDSTLAYVDFETGKLLEERRVPEPKASIRHLDVGEDGEVAVGFQVQREALDHEHTVPLAGVHRQGEEVRLFVDSQDQIELLNDYVGSVAIVGSARAAGFTSPRGDVAVFWHLDSGLPLGFHELADCSGVAASTDNQHFVISSSVGEVRTLRASDLAEVRSARRRFDNLRWDNHLVAVVIKESS